MAPRIAFVALATTACLRGSHSTKPDAEQCGSLAGSGCPAGPDSDASSLLQVQQQAQAKDAAHHEANEITWMLSQEGSESCTDKCAAAGGTLRRNAVGHDHDVSTNNGDSKAV